MGNHYKPQKGDPLKGGGEAWQPTPGRHVGRAGVGSPTARGRNKQEITVKNKKQKPGHVTTSVPYVRRVSPWGARKDQDVGQQAGALQARGRSREHAWGGGFIRPFASSETGVGSEQRERAPERSASISDIGRVVSMPAAHW